MIIPTLLESWLTLVHELMVTNSENSHHGLRRIVHGWNWSVPGDVWVTGIAVPFSKLGYKNDSSKLKQLARNYFNQEALQAANVKLRSRVERGSSQTSVGVAMGAGAKSSKSMGFCMQSVVVSHTKGNIRIDVFYRSTEVIQKFVADLKFLHAVVVPELLKGIDLVKHPITRVKFHFSNVYVSAMFFPLIYQFGDPVKTLKLIEDYDKRWWRIAAIDAFRMLRKDTNHSFRLHQQMYNFFQTLNVDRKTLKEYLTKKGIKGSDFRLINKLSQDEGDDE